MVYREAEITHGRVGMLASMGFLVQEWSHPLFNADGGPAISQMPKLPAGIWLAMMFGVGIAEGYRVNRGFNDPTLPDHFFQKLRPNYTPGDLGFDPLGLAPSNPAEFREMQTKELQNGRIGMLAAAVWAQDIAKGRAAHAWVQTTILPKMQKHIRALGVTKCTYQNLYLEFRPSF